MAGRKSKLVRPFHRPGLLLIVLLLWGEGRFKLCLRPRACSWGLEYGPGARSEALHAGLRALKLLPDNSLLPSRHARSQPLNPKTSNTKHRLP